MGKVVQVLNAARLRAVALVAMLSLLVSEMATAQVTLPSTGVDVEDYVTALVTFLGTGVAACIGAYFAFLGLRKILGWSRKVG